MIIGITGRKGSGKNEAALALESFTEVKFAGCLKEMARTFLRYQGCNAEKIERFIEGDLKEMNNTQYFGGKTSRQFQQYIGTEFGRDLIHTNLWVNTAMNQAYSAAGYVVFTDVRFPNEVAAIKQAGGRVVRIERIMKLNEYSNHESEALIDTLDVDFVIQNEGTKADLHDAIKAFVYG